jgi:hypothetical protein
VGSVGGSEVTVRTIIIIMGEEIAPDDDYSIDFLSTVHTRVTGLLYYRVESRDFAACELGLFSLNDLDHGGDLPSTREEEEARCQ